MSATLNIEKNLDYFNIIPDWNDIGVIPGAKPKYNI